MIDITNVEKYVEWKKKWNDSTVLGLLHYISFNIHPDDVLILGKLFFPELIEVEDFVFLKENFSNDVFEKARVNFKNDQKEIERTINQVHVYDIFANCTEDVKDSVFENVGKVLQLSWTIFFKKEFSNKEIIVDYSNSDQNYGPILTIFQK